MSLSKNIEEAASLIVKSKFLVAFTGAGISVESGIPPFRGAEGLWSKYDPQVLELDYFHRFPEDSWKVIKEIFYDFFGNAKPNPAHAALARLEELGLLQAVITQNIDNLHQEAGNTIVYEFHGNSQKLICTGCKKHFEAADLNFNVLPPYCAECNALIKPDFIFFGEAIPTMAFNASMDAASKTDVFIIIGSTGEVMPANQIPIMAKHNGATIIEINPEPSRYTRLITDLHLTGTAGEVMSQLIKKVEYKMEN
ncbi:MAG: SIR2 family NAD-dependent protein deacylase [Bacteroidota bacterium]